MAYQNKKYNKQNQPTMLEVIVVGIFKALWWLIKLPFGGGKKRSKISQQNIDYIRSKCLEISSLLDSQNEIELRHAVMEADKLVDHTMKIYGYSGETFADRLRSAEKYLDHNTYQSIWEGHKVRNRIAHEQELKISNYELGQAAKRLLGYVKNV